jgi:hypothetical protein
MAGESAELSTITVAPAACAIGTTRRMSKLPTLLLLITSK